VSVYALAPAGLANTAVVHVITANNATMGSLLRVKGPPRGSGVGARMITSALRFRVKKV
jgi:hypothetical protein